MTCPGSLAARVLILCLCFSNTLLSAGETYFVRTNYSDRVITNYVEVQMPRNVFVNQYHTNQVDHFRTNYVTTWSTNNVWRNSTNNVSVTRYHTNVLDAFHTNWHNAYLTNDVAVNLTRTNWVMAYHTNWHQAFLTNEVAVQLTRTNWITAYQTNWHQAFRTNMVAINQTQTNWVDAFHTNWHQAFLTNDLAVNLTQTNFVDRYHTNVQMLNFTNWQTVVVVKTNWVTDYVTNVAQIDVPAPAAVAAVLAPSSRGISTGSRATDRTSFAESKSAPSPGEEPVISAARTIKAAGNNHAEVVLKVNWPSDTADPLVVQQWKIEREDGSFLSFSQDAEVKRELAPGTYNVEARMRRAEDGAALVLRGTLVMTLQEAVVQQKPSSKKLFSSVQ